MQFEKVSMGQWTLANQNRDILGDQLVKDYDDIKLPVRKTKYSAGYDFFLPYDISVKAGVTYKVPTGIKCELDKGMIYTDLMDMEIEARYFLALYPRSSYGFKYGFTLNNTTGIIDADYYNNPDNEGHIFVAFTTDKDVELHKGDSFCQGIIQSYNIVDDDESVDERVGGIGSTGK